MYYGGSYETKPCKNSMVNIRISDTLTLERSEFFGNLTTRFAFIFALQRVERFHRWFLGTNLVSIWTAVEGTSHDAKGPNLHPAGVAMLIRHGSDVQFTIPVFDHLFDSLNTHIFRKIRTVRKIREWNILSWLLIKEPRKNESLPL